MKQGNLFNAEPLAENMDPCECKNREVMAKYRDREGTWIPWCRKCDKPIPGVTQYSPPSKR